MTSSPRVNSSWGRDSGCRRAEEKHTPGKNWGRKRNFCFLGHFTQGPHALKSVEGWLPYKGSIRIWGDLYNSENWKLQLAIMLPNFRQVLFYNPAVFSVLASESLSRLSPSTEGKRKRKRKAVVGWAYDNGGAGRGGQTLTTSQVTLLPWLTLLLYSQYSVCSALFGGVMKLYQALWQNDKMYVSSEKYR